MTAHVAGVPVEEALPVLIAGGASVLAALRMRFARRTERAPDAAARLSSQAAGRPR